MKIFNGFLNLARFLAAVAVFVFVFLYIEKYTGGFFQGEKHAAVKAAMRYLLLEGAGGFVAMFLALAVVGRAVRIINGTIILFIMTVTYFIFYSLPMFQSTYWMSWLAALVAISFLTFGMCGAQMVWGKIPTIWKSKQKQAKPPKVKVMPKVSGFITVLGIVSVPAAYVTIIFSSLITLGICLWALFLVFQLPRIPVVLLVGIGITPLVAIWSAFIALKVMFNSAAGFQPAVKVSLNGKPGLKKMLGEVCGAVGTKLPDNVILHAEPTFFVSQAATKCYDGEVKGRTLAIGAPIIGSLSETELRAVLAHEFAHFSGRDTVYSLYVAPVYGILSTAMAEMASPAASKVGNGAQAIMIILLAIPILFIKMFLNYFATIDNMISRGREFRADWIAALNYGKEAAGGALQKVIQISGHYYDHGAAAGYDNPNFFREYAKLTEKERDKLEEYAKKAMEEEEQQFDTHPTIAARLAAMPDTQSKKFAESSFSILSEFTSDEERLSEFFQKQMKEIKKNNETVSYLDSVYYAINGAQVDLINFMAKSHDKLKKENKDNMDWVIACLVLGDKPDGAYAGKVKKLILILKENKEGFAILMKGTAIRLKAYAAGGLKETVDKIKAQYAESGLAESLPEADSGEMQAVTEYVEEVKKWTGAGIAGGESKVN